MGVDYQVVCHQTDPEWHEERRNSIGSSDAQAIAGTVGWASAIDVQMEKWGTHTRDVIEETERMRVGRRMEATIGEMFVEEAHDVTAGMACGFLLRHDQFPHLHTTPDWDVQTTEPAKRFVEIKNTDRSDGEDWQTQVPRRVFVQCQHHLIVTGEPWMYAVGLVRGNMLRWQVVPRDERWISEWLETTEQFWKATEAGSAWVDGTERCKKALALLYPEAEVGKTVQGPADLVSVACVLEQTKITLKALEHQRREAENAIKAAMGDAERMVLPDGSEFTWKTQSRGEYTVPAKTFRGALRYKEGK